MRSPLPPKPTEKTVDESDDVSPLPSGVNVRDADKSERETTPAPPTTNALTMTVPRGGDADATPSEAFEVSGAVLRHETVRLPIDVAIPTRTATKPPEDLPHRLGFLLLVVDGRSTIAELATQNDLPLDEVLAGFVDLVGAGLVDLRV